MLAALGISTYAIREGAKIRDLKFCSKNGANRIITGPAPFFLCGYIDSILGGRELIFQNSSYIFSGTVFRT